MSAAWSFAIVRLFGLLAVALLGGLIWGRPLVWLAAVLGCYLFLQLYHLYQLNRWLRLRNFLEPPQMGGVWGDVIAQVVRLHRRKHFHKQRMMRLFRELRRSTAAMPDGVIVLNSDNEILWFNRTAGRLLNLRRKADLRLRIDNLVRAPDFVRYLAEGDRSVPVIVRWPLGSELYLSMRLIPYGAGQQLMLVRDVTRQSKLEAMRRDFVANASHELRSPLTVISGYLQTWCDALADGETSDSWSGPVREMRRQAQRMTEIIQDLLELSKLESTDTEAADDDVDVVGMLTLIGKELQSRPSRPRGFKLTVDTHAKLMGSEAEIHSAFSNLVANAVKYTPSEGEVEVRWWADGAGAHLSVRDTGIGIPPEHIPRLTERFYRVDEGRARQHGGSGLGLSIVKHVLQRHGARLEIESEEGVGSTFTCHFPRRRVLAPEHVAEADALG